MKCARLPQLLSTRLTTLLRHLCLRHMHLSLTPLFTLLPRVLSEWDHSFLGKIEGEDPCGRYGVCGGAFGSRQKGGDWKGLGRNDSKEDVSRVLLYCMHLVCFPAS